MEAPDRDGTLEEERRALLLVIGLPGSGKSTLARRLAMTLGVTRLSSDAVRTERGLRGNYAAETIDAVYSEMFERARGILAQGQSVLLDASFSSRRYRQLAQSVAEGAGARLLIIRMMANEAVSLARVSRKRRQSEAGADVYRLLRTRFDEVQGEHLILDSSEARISEMAERARRYVTAQLETPDEGTG